MPPPTRHRTCDPEGSSEVATCSDCVSCRMQLRGRDVGISADSREVGVAEIRRHQARVAGSLPEPGRSGVTERMRRHALVDPCAFGGVRMIRPRIVR